MPEIRIAPETDLLTPGQPYRVPIVVIIDQPTKVRGLHATLHGAEETKATYTTYNAATKSTQVQTAVEHVDIVRAEFLLSGNERKGAFSNMADGLATLFGGGEHDVLEPGEYPFEVEIELPPNARSAFEGKKCRVFYELSVLIDIPMWRDTRQTQPFQLNVPPAIPPEPQGPVRTRYPEDEGRGLLDALVTPDVQIEAAVAEGTLRDGEEVDGFVVIRTPKPLQYQSIRARIIAVESTTAHGHTDRYTHAGEPVCIASDGVIQDEYSAQFKLPVVNPGVGTLSGELFTIDCYVQVELDVPWAKDPKIRVPVTLA